MSVTSIDLLVSAKKIANKVQDGKCIYSNSGCKKDLSGVLSSKKTNCANYVSLILQDLKILPKGTMFYFDSTGKIKWQGDQEAGEKALKKYFQVIQVNRYGLPLTIQPSDICGWYGHTNMFAGFKDGDTRKPMWWDAGRSGTKDGKPDSGPFTKIHRQRDLSGLYMTTILRLKEDIYYPKYNGRLKQLDAVLKAVGVPSKYLGDKNRRYPLALRNGIKNYSGTLTQNLKLIDLAKSGKLIRIS